MSWQPYSLSICQDVGRVRLGDGAVGQPDPVEALVLHGPEHVPPRAVQRLDGAVAFRAPCPERAERVRGVAEGGVVAAVLVVDLPGHEVRAPAVALGEQARDAAAFLAVSVVAEAVVAAGAEPPRLAPGAGRKHVGVPVEHPAGRRRRGRPQHHLQPRRPQRLDRPVQPAEPELPGTGLDARPRELADAHPADAGLHHPGRILRPDRLRPVLRVVADPEGAFHARPPRRRSPSSTHTVSGNDHGRVGPWSVSHAPGASMARRPSTGVARESFGTSASLTSRTR